MGWPSCCRGHSKRWRRGPEMNDVYFWCLEKRAQILERLQRLRDGGETDATPLLIDFEMAHLQHLDQLIAKYERTMGSEDH